MAGLISVTVFIGLLLLGAGAAAQTPAPEKAEKPAEQILIERGGVLLPRGSLVIEPNLQYSHYSRHRISISGFTLLEAIVVGEIAVSDLKRDILQAALTTRYGFTSWMEGEVKVPYLFRMDREVKGPGTTEPSERSIDDHGLGDVEGALYFHLLRARRYIPDVIFNVRAKSPSGRSPYNLPKGPGNVLEELPTGNGHWGVSGGFTLVKASDPAVFFGSFSYFWNLKQDVGYGLGEIDPGDSIEYSLGVAYALNEKFSLSTTYQQRFTGRTQQEGNKVLGSSVNAATLFVGGSYALSRRVFLNVSVGIGLTPDAPNVQLTIGLPIHIF